MNYSKTKKKFELFWANFWAGPFSCFSFDPQNDPQSRSFFKKNFSHVNSLDPRIILSQFPEDPFSTSYIGHVGQRLPKILTFYWAQKSTLCHSYDPPKPGVDRADYDFFGSKIAKNCLKTPKVDSMCLQNGRKLCPINFCGISEPPNWGKRLNLTSLRSKLPKITQKGQNEALHPQK